MARYDCVLHLVTAADGAKPFYTLENNATRTEGDKCPSLYVSRGGAATSGKLLLPPQASLSNPRISPT